MLRRARRSPRGSDEPGAPLWMVTYSDMVTLILTFFVLLFSFSSLDVQRFYALLSALQGSWGILDRGAAVDPTRTLDAGSLEADIPLQSLFPTSQVEETVGELEAFIAEAGLQDDLDVIVQERGVVVRLADHVLFDLGKAELRPDARAILDRLAEPLRRWPNEIRVEGHTDNWPIRTAQFPSNWELSTARATTVLRYLVEQQQLPPERMAAVGYGEFRPLRPNDTPENRAMNRRVDIVLLHAGEIEAGGTGGGAAGRGGE